MNFAKTGIIKSPAFYESDAQSLVIESQRLASYSYVPSQGTNSCIQGWDVDFTGCTSGETIYCIVDVAWSGFDTSNTEGTFSMWFQGSNYKVSTSSWAWEGSNCVCTALNSTNLKTLVLSTATGNTTIVSSITIPSTYPDTYSKSHVGLRTDYSNGIGKITLRNLRVVKEKYYVPPRYDGSPSLHIGKNFISSGGMYEL